MSILRGNLPFYVLAGIFIFHSIILNNLIFLPYPEFFIYPYLTNQGLLPYKQIFDQHFPGLMFLPLNFGNLGMTTPAVARAWLISTVLITQLLIYFITNKITGDKKKGLMACFLYLIWQPFLEGWTFWIDNIIPIFLLPAFYFSYKYLKNRTFWDITAVGFFMSLAVLFKQVFIPLYLVLGLVFLLRFKSIKAMFCYGLGFLPVTLLWVGFFYLKGVFNDLFFWTVTFNLTTFAKEGTKPPFFSGLIRVGWIYLPILLTIFLKDKIITLLFFVFLLGSLSGDISRFDLVHFQTSLPFIVIATSLVFFEFYKRSLFKPFILLYLVVGVVWLVTFYKGHIGDKIFFFDNQTLKIAEKIKENSDPGEEIFLLGPIPLLYQMTETIPAGRIFVFQFPWFLIESEDKFLKALEQHKPNLVVRDSSVVIEDKPITKFAVRLNDYIDQNYVVFDKVGSTEFLKRKDENRI